MDKNSTKRKYDSTRRKSQARQTRLQILEAARSVFDERGYTGATIEAIAAQAGVAVETVYAVFGSKAGILKSLIDITVVGDDQPVPLLQREEILAVEQIQEPHAQLQKFAADIYAIMARMSPLFALLRIAAKTDPEIASLQRQLLDGRMQGMSYLVRQLERIQPLREGLSTEQAAETLWVASSAEVFQLLTADRGWTREQYCTWLADSLAKLLY
jgi:TetR/AcrR family transcriptional regulator, regulator of autoinduction and epiphytic fitness